MFFSKIKLFDFRAWLKNISLRKKIFFVGSAFGLLVAIYFIVAIIFVDSIELKLVELRDSWQTEKICHEKCARARAEQEELIVSGLKNKLNSPAALRLEQYFLDEKEDISFRLELISLVSRAWGSETAPEYFKNYLANSSGRPDIQAKIMSTYGSSQSLDYYFEILTSARDWRLKQAAIKVLSNYPDKVANFSISQLAFLKKIVLDPNTENRLRRPLILLLADYYLLFPKETAEIIRTIYKTEFRQDSISRAFAADILNRLGEAKLIVPVVSAAEWDEYYND